MGLYNFSKDHLPHPGPAKIINFRGWTFGVLLHRRSTLYRTTPKQIPLPWRGGCATRRGVDIRVRVANTNSEIIEIDLCDVHLYDGGMSKKIISFLVAILMVTPVCAYVDRETAVVRIMSKAAGRAQTVNLTVGQTTEFEKLSLTLRACKQSDPFDAENNFMFIEISKASDGQIFGGWMNRNEPGENPLQDADYDVWLVRCE